MRSTMHISLPEPLKEWVEEQVSERGFGTASEYVRQLLREEQIRQARETVDQKLLAAIERGKPIPGEEVFKRLRKRNAARSRKAR